MNAGEERSAANVDRSGPGGASLSRANEEVRLPGPESPAANRQDWRTPRRENMGAFVSSDVTTNGVNAVVEAARQLVTVADSTPGTSSFWKAYEELREEIAAYEQDA